jgi:hypothetical protein
MRTSSNLSVRALHWRNFLSLSRATADGVEAACNIAGGVKLVGEVVGTNGNVMDTVGLGGRLEELVVKARSGEDSGRWPNEWVTAGTGGTSAGTGGPTPGSVNDVDEGMVGGGGMTEQYTMSACGS